jgi:hypothetical protein
VAAAFIRATAPASGYPVASLSSPSFDVAAGQSIILGCYCSDTITGITDTAGNSYGAAVTSGNSLQFFVVYSSLAKTGNVITITCAAGNIISLAVGVYSGLLDGGFDVDGSGQQAGSPATEVTSAAFTPSEVGEVAVAFGYCPDGFTAPGNGWSAEAEYVLRSGNNNSTPAINVGGAMEDRLNAPTSSQTAAIGNSTSVGIMRVLVATFRAAPTPDTQWKPMLPDRQVRSRWNPDRNAVFRSGWAPENEPSFGLAVRVFEYQSDVGVEKTGSTLRFRGSVNTSGAGVTDSLRQGDGPYVFSFEKWLRLEVLRGTYSSLRNLRFRFSGQLGSEGRTDPARYRVAYRLATTRSAPVRPDPGAFPPPGFLDADGFQDDITALTIYAGEWNASSAIGAGLVQPFLVLVLGVGYGAEGGIVTGPSGIWTWEEP